MGANSDNFEPALGNKGRISEFVGGFDNFQEHNLSKFDGSWSWSALDFIFLIWWEASPRWQSQMGGEVQVIVDFLGDGVYLTGWLVGWASEEILAAALRVL